MANPILSTACDFHGKYWDLLQAANLRHGTDGFTSPSNEGMLRIFSPEKSDGFSLSGFLHSHNSGRQQQTLVKPEAVITV
jgi:hypothetical protein